MPIIHTIRLHGPWIAKLDQGEPQKIQMPQVREAAGSVTLERSFGSPTGLTNERVFLVIEGLVEATLELNGKAITTADDRVDVTDSLLSRNKFVLTTDGPFFTAARLEICEPS